MIFLLCLFALQNAYWILSPHFYEVIPEEKESCQAVFRASWATFLTWGLELLEEEEKKLLKKSAFLLIETRLRELRPRFVTNESSSEPWRTVERCLFVFERIQVMWSGGGGVRCQNFGRSVWQSAETPSGNFGAIVNIEVFKAAETSWQNPSTDQKMFYMFVFTAFSVACEGAEFTKACRVNLCQTCVYWSFANIFLAPCRGIFFFKARQKIKLRCRWISKLRMKNRDIISRS